MEGLDLRFCDPQCRCTLRCTFKDPLRDCKSGIEPVSTDYVNLVYYRPRRRRLSIGVYRDRSKLEFEEITQRSRSVQTRRNDEVLSSHRIDHRVPSSQG